MVKTHRHSQLFLYCSGGERSVKCVRPALEMESSKDEQRGVGRFLMGEGTGTREIHRRISKRPGMLLDGIIFFHDNAHPHTANLVRDSFRDLAEKHYNILRTAHILLLVTTHFWRPHSWTSVSFGRGNARLGEVVDPSATYLFLQDWN